MKLYVICCRTFVVLAIALAIAHSSCEAKTLPIATLIHSAAAANAIPVATPQIKSYREWKLSMISESDLRVKNLKESLWKSRTSASSSTEAGLNPVIQNIQNKIDKEELQFSLAQDLTITDYFVGYLTKQKSLNTAIKEVSGRLSAEEVAELMTAYADNFFASKPAPIIQAPRADSGF